MKRSYFFLVSLSLLMASCVNENSFDTSSSFKITSPMNGAYELANETPFSFQTKGNYFSLYSPIGQYDIKSIKLEFSDVLTPKEKSKNIEIYTINDTHGGADTIVDSASNKLALFFNSSSYNKDII